MTKTTTIKTTAPTKDASFLEKLQSINPVTAALKTFFTFEQSADTLDIFPQTTFAKNKLDKDDIRANLIEASGCPNIVIHEVIKKSDNIPSASHFSAIINEEEMEEYGGEIPFD